MMSLLILDVRVDGIGYGSVRTAYLVLLDDRLDCTGGPVLAGEGTYGAGSAPGRIQPGDLAGFRVSADLPPDVPVMLAGAPAQMPRMPATAPPAAVGPSSALPRTRHAPHVD
jgi:hypothetical protein